MMGKNFDTLEAGGYYADGYGAVCGPVTELGGLFLGTSDGELFIYGDGGQYVGYIGIDDTAVDERDCACPQSHLIERVNADGSPWIEPKPDNELSRVTAERDELEAIMRALADGNPPDYEQPEGHCPLCGQLITDGFADEHATYCPYRRAVEWCEKHKD